MNQIGQKSLWERKRSAQGKLYGDHVPHLERMGKGSPQTRATHGIRSQLKHLPNVSGFLSHPARAIKQPRQATIRSDCLRNLQLAFLRGAEKGWFKHRPTNWVKIGKTCQMPVEESTDHSLSVSKRSKICSVLRARLEQACSLVGLDQKFAVSNQILDSFTEETKRSLLK